MQGRWSIYIGQPAVGVLTTCSYVLYALRTSDGLLPKPANQVIRPFTPAHHLHAGSSPMTNRRRYSAASTAASGLILAPSAALSLLQCSCSSFFTTVGFIVAC